MSELPDPESFGDYASWPGREVHGPGGRLGKVVEIYLDDATDRPEWVLVELDEGSRFVPLAGGTVRDETIQVAHGAKAVSNAPDYELSKELTQDQERELYDHYAIPVSEEASDSLLPETEAMTVPDPTPAPTEPAREPEPAPEPAAAAVVAPVPDPTPEPVPTPEPPAPPVPVTEPATEPVAALPPEGETSEPKNQGPMIPPRPEPVAPPPPPPPPPTPPAGADSSAPPAPVIAGAVALAILLLILLRRRSS